MVRRAPRFPRDGVRHELQVRRAGSQAPCGCHVRRGVIRLVEDEAQTPLLEAGERKLPGNLLRLLAVYHGYKRFQLLSVVGAEWEGVVKVDLDLQWKEVHVGRLDYELPEPALP